MAEEHAVLGMKPISGLLFIHSLNSCHRQSWRAGYSWRQLVDDERLLPNGLRKTTNHVKKWLVESAFDIQLIQSYGAVVKTTLKAY